eukprot:gene11110-7736_t
MPNYPFNYYYYYYYYYYLSGYLSKFWTCLNIFFSSLFVLMSSSSVDRNFTSKKKVDDRLKTLINDVAEQKHRGLVLLIGDRGKDQVVNLHQMISRANHSAKVDVLWCMREDPDFGSTGKKVQERRARLEVKGGLATEATKEAFQLFLSQTHIRFCKYKESHKILGQTYGMAVLQDFEAISPNILARTMETVKGGGLIVIMFRAMRSLKQLYTIAMDVHSRYRTESHQDIVPRFNERFLLSLMDCDTALCLDDDLNVLPITEKMKNYGKNISSSYDTTLALQGQLKHEADLISLKDKLKPSSSVGPLVHLCQTLDQAKTVLSLMQVVTEKSLDATCVVTAGRGRGKSAALGIAAAGAVVQGYSNIFCTAPSPENLQTFFEFAVKGLVEFGYKERVEFEVLQSSSEEFSKLIVRINVFRDHRQTIQFIAATDVEKFAQAELAIIDEAAALPLTKVKSMLGPYLIFLSSTVSGYEGTGRSLSMKLVADMRQRSQHGGGRALKEISMSQPIRYGPNDPVERWLHTLLCLNDSPESTTALSCAPHPTSCELFYVDRDALFSYHPLAEKLLQRIQTLLAAAHYKNQPNDLQLLSDAPGHHLFVLCSVPSDLEGKQQEIPEVFCVIHACEEGDISAESVKNYLSRGLRPSGDLIPYTLSQFFIEDSFAHLSGLRIVRIATHPELQRGGYGSHALGLLSRYFNGEISLTRAPKVQQKRKNSTGDESMDADNTLAPRKSTPNLLVSLCDRPYEPLDYLGASYGLTIELFNFWTKAGYTSLYIRQAPNELTGEHSCVMVKPMGFDISPLRLEFRRRFIRLLSMPFRNIPTILALSVLQDFEAHDPHKFLEAVDLSEAENFRTKVGGVFQATWNDICAHFSGDEIKRLKLFSTSFLESGNILDLLPRVAQLYFEHKLFRLPSGGEGIVLSYAQAAVLLVVGLQCRTIEQLGEQDAFKEVPTQQLRAFFRKAVTRIVEYFQRLEQDGKPTEDSVAGETVQEREIYDASGKLVGLSVSKSKRSVIGTDTTLLREAKQTLLQEGRKEPETLQDVFYRPKKKSRHQ